MCVKAWPFGAPSLRDIVAGAVSTQEAKRQKAAFCQGGRARDILAKRKEILS